MLYLLWSLLNIGLAIFLIIICFRLTRQINERYGIWITVLFVFVLLSFTTSNNNEADSIETNKWNFTPIDSLSANSMSVVYTDLKKTSIGKYTLGIQYGKDKELKHNLPVSAWSIVEGVVSGTRWKPFSIIVNYTEDNEEFEYDVSGIIIWKLLGIEVYNQSKNWKGVVALE